MEAKYSFYPNFMLLIPTIRSYNTKNKSTIPSKITPMAEPKPQLSELEI
jgi:hypothetical protein